MKIELITEIAAPPEVCFDLARDIDFHMRSLEGTHERAVAGVTTGLIGLGEEVTFRGRHFGIILEHASRITAFDRPHLFTDTMVRGMFRTYAHDHVFEPFEGGTRMIDRAEFAAPLGVLGRLAEALFVARYVKSLFHTRARAIKREAESLANG